MTDTAASPPPFFSFERPVSGLKRDEDSLRSERKSIFDFPGPNSLLTSQLKIPVSPFEGALQVLSKNEKPKIRDT
jgi:hypothetical protein